MVMGSVSYMRVVSHSPPAKDTMTTKRRRAIGRAWPQHERRINAAGLTFTFQMLIGAIFATATIIGSFWLVTSSLRSDVRNTNTLMESWRREISLQRDIDRERAERAAEKQQTQSDAMKATVETTQ